MNVVHIEVMKKKTYSKLFNSIAPGSGVLVFSHGSNYYIGKDGVISTDYFFVPDLFNHVTVCYDTIFSYLF